ncbi:DNA cytosine methyltransferase [Candidatus Chloroploca sp. Khr17]|uniref:DNA cytosine methyltransferase n=1 Tax=Candidatus Chloroploca sp. Khr17 TaxID=2496869 RepID=UPI00196A44D1|nr:DNA cytosine methyltransferase [Candidatus Chloroploca sp. Khr17]
MQMAQESSSQKVEPTVLDIFCGAGGMSLGFKNGGCQILGGIDQNRYAIDTHHKNFPSAALKLPPQDIRGVRNLDQLGLNPGSVDILVGGPPCQVFSRVGIGKMRKLGRDIESDHRNFLYTEFVRFVAYYKPLCFVMENVDNLANKEETLARISNDFRGNTHNDYPGYNVAYRVLDASDFGVPQKRMRLFIIGVRSDLEVDPPFPTKQDKQPISVSEAISDLPDLEPFVMPLKTKSSGPKQKDAEQPYKCSPHSPYQQEMRKRKKEGEGVWNHLCRSHNDKDIMIFEMLDQGGKYRDIPEEMMRYRVDIFDDKYKRLISNKPAWTLTAHMRKDGLAYIHPLQNRSISVREAARIQSFPDDFVFYAPMTRMFELVGNSVPPLLAEAVAKPLVHLIHSYRKEQKIS